MLLQRINQRRFLTICVIDLSQKKDSAVYLRIGGRKWFDGMMGVSEKHIAVKIRRVYHNVERRDSQVNEQ